MIENMWYAILESKEIKQNKPIGVTRLSQKLVLWRSKDGELHCIFDKCCHRGAALHKGKIVDDHIECPFHGFQYDSSGKVKTIPANGRNSPVSERFKVNAYVVKEAYGFVWVWNGKSKENLPEIPFFKELREGYAYSSFSENWGVHYTRAIENQLDVVHLPFVHTSTIGKGNKTLVNGPVVKWEDNLMTFYVYNAVDQGQKPLKPEQIDHYERLFHLQLQMPNLWQNIISDKIRIVAVFAPIDEDHTQIYLRFYQNFMTLPLLKDAVGFLSSISNKIILHQDRRVVLTQLPKKTDLNMDENLIQGDRPIVEFRRKRQQLQELESNEPK
jgi:phenylpropionate dioxygenase-like ring-hydroxylating dioxygenase large terminal subunit